MTIIMPEDLESLAKPCKQVCISPVDTCCVPCVKQEHLVLCFGNLVFVLLCYYHIPIIQRVSNFIVKNTKFLM